MNICDVIRVIEKERQKQGITIEDLAEQACICRATYYHWIEDRVSPSLFHISLVMDVLNLDIDVHRKKKGA